MIFWFSLSIACFAMALAGVGSHTMPWLRLRWSRFVYSIRNREE